MNAVETHNQVADHPQALFKPVAEQQTTPPATAGPLPGRPTGPDHPARAVRMIATPDGSGLATPDGGRPRTERRRSIDTASREDREDAFLLFNCMLQASESTSATNSSDDGSDGTSPTPKRRSGSSSPAQGPDVAPLAAGVTAEATAAAWDKRKLKECGPVSAVRLHSPSKRAKTTVGGFSAFEGGRTLFNKTRAIEHADDPAGGTASMLTMQFSLSGAETSPEKMSMAARAAAVLASDKDDEPDAVKLPGMSEDQWSKKVNKMKGNRLAAKRCRERKKQYISYLEKRIAFLEGSNAELQSALQTTVRGYRVQTGPYGQA